MADKSLDDIPSEYEIKQAIELLRPMFLEAYRREKAYNMFPSAIGISYSDDRIDNDGGFENYDGGMAHWVISFSAYSPSFIRGYYRRSSTLGIYMPDTFPPDAISNQNEVYANSWVASTSSDDDTIETYAQEQAKADIDSILTSYEVVLDECALWRVEIAMGYLDTLGEGMDDIFDTHEDTDFADISELWGNWDGEDAEAGYEVFGQQVGIAAGNQRQILANLVRVVNEEAVAQGEALTELHNAVAAAGIKIEEAIDKADPQMQALKRVIGNVLVNRVPYLSDALYVTDYGFEVNSDGAVQGKATGGVMTVMDAVFPSSDQVPTVPLMTGVRDVLVGVGEACKTDLYDARKSSNDGYLDDAADDYSRMNRDAIWQLIPGYIK